MIEEKDFAKELVDAIVSALKADTLTLSDALALIELGKEKAREIGVPMVITVVDGGGNLIAQERMDDALIGSISISLAKAYTAAVLRNSTDEIAKTVQPGQPLYGLAETGGGHFCVFGGGVPIMRNGRCVGGLGVSGGSAAQDTSVARFATDFH